MIALLTCDVAPSLSSRPEFVLCMNFSTSRKSLKSMKSPIFTAKILSVKLKNNINKSYTKIKIFKPTVYVVSAFSRFFDRWISWMSNEEAIVEGVPDKSVLLWSQIAQSPCIGCVWNFERRIRRHIRSTFVSMTFLSHDPVYYFFDDIWDFQILQKRIFGKKFANFISCRT